MRRLLLLILIFSASIAAKADGKSLFIKFYDGSKIEYVLSASPEVTMANDKMTITSGDTETSYDLWKVSEFTFGESTGINQVVVEKDAMLQGNKIVIPNGSLKVKIFSIDGKSVSVAPIKVGNRSVIDLESLAKGVYIINIEGKSVKVSRK